MQKQVAVLMGCYNGEAYLCEQIDSLLQQSHKAFDLWFSDDGSTDKTIDIIRDYQKRISAHRFELVQGPGLGFVQNFLSLILRDEIQADYFAYADQDDIWQKDKLKRALSWLDRIPENQAALYTSRTRMIDQDGFETGELSPCFNKKPSFANALMQNIAGGNTMVMNKPAREIMKQVSKNQNPVNYDWWTYLVLSGVGAKVFYDKTPHILYRQHGENLIGANMGSSARFFRIKDLFAGKYYTRNQIHINALEEMKDRLTLENKKIFERFSKARKQAFFARIWGMWRCGIYCQTAQAHLGLILAVLLNKL